jgi:putative SOS response-associated peptidase YedK
MRQRGSFPEDAWRVVDRTSRGRACQATKGVGPLIPGANTASTVDDGGAGYPGGICGRYTNVAEPAALEQRFGVAIPFSEGTRRYNIAPTQTVVAIVLGDDGEPEARAMRWGLIPPWARDARIAHKMINARSETADQKPAYKKLIATATRRALIPADGFYEWLKPEDRKQQRIPFRFTLADESLFAFAGLWTPGFLAPRSADEKGEKIATVTILTTSANDVVARLHDRMPVILPDRESELAWLSSELDGAAAKTLCVPLASHLLTAAPANPLLNKATSDVTSEGPELLVAIGEAA